MKKMDFFDILKQLELIAEKAEKEKADDERRKLLPLPYQLKYLEKLTKKLKLLRGKLSEKERKMAARIGRIERQSLRAYQKGLDSIR
jgi:hypothetical protein